MRQSMTRTLRALLCAIVSLPILGGCATLQTLFAGQSDSPVDVNAVACSSFKPITWADGDTDATLAQIHEHNSVWLTLCSEEAER